MQDLTPERIRAVLGESPLVTPEFVADMVATANADGDEGAEWLPYYKLSLGILAQAFGMMDVVAVEGLRAAYARGFDADSATARWAEKREKLLGDARDLFRLHLRPTGIGPDESPERAAAVDALIADQMGGLTWTR